MSTAAPLMTIRTAATSTPGKSIAISQHIVGLVDVDGGRALAGQRVGPDRATQLEKDATEVLAELANAPTAARQPECANAWSG